MASVLNRANKQFLASANTPDFPVVDWIINPDMSAVAGVPSKYWVIAGDVVSEMSQVNKDIVDADELAAQVTSEIAESGRGFMRRFILVFIDEINIVRASSGLPNRSLAQIRNKMRAK